MKEFVQYPLPGLEELKVKKVRPEFGQSSDADAGQKPALAPEVPDLSPTLPGFVSIDGRVRLVLP